MPRLQAFSAFPILLLACMTPSFLYAWDVTDAERLWKKMNEVWAGVNDYQAEVEVTTFRRDEPYENRRFRYTFKKPKWIRIDFESSHPGMILVYPDPEGKAVLRRFFDFHLDPGSLLLRDPSGQRIDQTDLGLLIRNIHRSCTDQLGGPVEAGEDDDFIRLRLLSENHFRKGILTRYEFTIDKRVWLPVRVEESTPEGALERTIAFRDLRTNLGFPQSFFQLERE
jgi:outer membrane lipoprotein-sorting protein